MKSRESIIFLLGTGILLQFAPKLSAQGSPPFQLFIQDPTANSTAVANGSSVTVSADALNQPVVITLTARYVGTGTATVSGQAQFFGSPQFSVSGVKGPTTLTPGDSFTVTITYNPTSTNQASGQILIPYSELDANRAPLSSGSIALTLVGTAPKFVVTYFYPNDQNVIQLSDGDTLPFLDTAIGGNSIVDIAIQNLGSGPGAIKSVKLTGPAFQLQGLPLLPGTVNSGTALQFSIKYTPTQAVGDQGTLQVVFADHTVTVNLIGTGTAPKFTYQLVVNGVTSDIAPNQTLSLPALKVGVTGTFSIVVQNNGNGPGTIPSVAVIGAGFQLIDSPTFPQTLTPKAFINLTFSYTPSQSGSFTAQLRIGADSFTLSAQGSGSQLIYSYTSSAGSKTVLPTGTVVFSPVQLSQSTSTFFSIQNTGTANATVISISIQPAKSSFTLVGLPPVPLTLAPNASAGFTIVFNPLTTGTNTATLAIDTQSFTLSGAGNPPPALPAYQFTGANGTQQPSQQPMIGLSLTNPYPLPISGTMTISEMPDGFNADPAVLFATGGQNVAFTIPANTLQAIFPNGATSIRIQTGTVSGTISLTATFTTSGGLDISPANPLALVLTVPAIPPQLIGAQVTSSSANGFTLQVTGIATSRKLSKLDFTFTTAATYNLASTQISVDVTSVAAAWFQSAQSTPFGGEFAITIPFTFTSTATGAIPSGTLQSVGVDVRNDLGTSNIISTQLQ